MHDIEIISRRDVEKYFNDTKNFDVVIKEFNCQGIIIKETKYYKCTLSWIKWLGNNHYVVLNLPTKETIFENE